MRALAYFPRQLRDLVMTRGAAIFVIALLFALPTLLMDYSGAPQEPDWHRMFVSALNDAALIGVLVATYGLIGEDVRRGYFRILFAKPISPVWYYVQAFAGAVITFYLALLAVTAIFAVVREPVWPGWALLRVGVLFLLMGGIVFGASRFTRLDWIVGFTLLVLGEVLRSAFPAAESLLGQVFNVLLPPSHLFDERLVTGQGVEWGPLLWIVSYAGLWIAAGLASVRIVPFGSAR